MKKIRSSDQPPSFADANSLPLNRGNFEPPSFADANSLPLNRGNFEPPSFADANSLPLNRGSIIIFGLGISGNAAAKFLLENNYQVLAGDDNKNSLLALDKYLDSHPNLKPNLQIIENLADINWTEVSSLVLAAGIPLYYPKPHPIAELARKNNCPIICDVEILYLFNQSAKFIGITGTNGKSTTTALIGHIFDQTKKPHATGGNIGIAALDLPKLQSGENYIIEMSSYQLDLITQTRFHIANLLNITPDHLDRHKDMAGYIAAKKRIFLNQTSGDFAIIDVDNINSYSVYQDLKNNPNFKAKLIAISTKKIVNDGITIIGNVIHNRLGSQESLIDLGERYFLKGEHNSQNIAFAFASCFLSNIAETDIIAAIKTFKGLKHRMQLVGKIANINFINDSKATNADSTENALKPYDDIYWILGGKPKDGGIQTLTKYFPKVKYAFLIGEASNEFAKTLENQVQYFKCNDLKTAFELAYSKALEDNSPNEKNILLSPACASFDQWKNFEERGDYFCKLVENLKQIQ